MSESFIYKGRLFLDEMSYKMYVKSRDCRNCLITFNEDAPPSGSIYRDHTYDEWCYFEKEDEELKWKRY